MRSIRFGYVGFGVLALASSVVVACGDDGASGSPSGGTGGAAPGAGGAGTGGAASGGAASGGAASGGASVGGGGAASGSGGGQPVTRDDISITGTITQCTGTTAPTLPDITATTCTAEGCSAATCVDESLVRQFAPTTDLALVGTCSPGVLCLPNDFIATGGNFLPKSCTSLQGAEGRCISKCIPRVAVQAQNLPKDTCADSELCAPCVDPIDGTSTTACDQGCDVGADPQIPPVVFAKCGMDKGVCVPEALVPADLKAAVPVDTCTGQGELCAPIEKAKDIDYKFTRCESTDPVLMAAVTMANSEGWLYACVPTYIVPEAQRSLLKQETCAAGDMCAPCFNPLMGQVATGACVP